MSTVSSYLLHGNVNKVTIDDQNKFLERRGCIRLAGAHDGLHFSSSKLHRGSVGKQP